MSPARTNTLPLPAILDIEASGFGRGSYPIEIGAVLPDGSSYCRLIKPPPHWQAWSEEAENLHGISRELLQTSGASCEEVAEGLNEFLNGRTVYTNAWGNDYSWLMLLFEEARRPLSFKLESIHTQLNDSQKSIWHETFRRVQVMLGEQRHRASSDARALQMTWHWTRNCETSGSRHAAVPST